MPPVLRPYRESDLADLVRINDAATPAVPVTPPEEFAALVAASRVTLVADDGAPAGFVIALPPGLPYASENYRFFSERSSDFLYVDRIVLDARLRGQGVGPRLYAELETIARADGAREITLEVNTRPANPGSLAFHAREGFVEVGRHATKGGLIEVALLARRIDPVG